MTSKKSLALSLLTGLVLIGSGEAHSTPGSAAGGPRFPDDSGTAVSAPQELPSLRLTKRHLVSRLDLHPRLIENLNGVGFRLIADLTKTSAPILRSKPGIGQVSVTQIETALAKEGLSLLTGDAAFKAEVRAIPHTMRLHHYLSLPLVVKLRSALTGIREIDSLLSVLDDAWMKRMVPDITDDELQELRRFAARAGVPYYRDELERQMTESERYNGSFGFDVNVEMSTALFAKLEKYNIDTWDDALTRENFSFHRSLRGQEIKEWQTLKARLELHRQKNPPSCRQSLKR